VHRLIAPRDQKYQSNFVEVRGHCLAIIHIPPLRARTQVTDPSSSQFTIHYPLFTLHSSTPRPFRLVPLDEVTPRRAPLIPQFRNDKIVYRRYAGLFFCVCVDSNDNELAYLEAIHLFVEVLGAYWRGVAWNCCLIHNVWTQSLEARLLLRFCFPFALARLCLCLRC
jgi:hypothetical protein